MYRRILVPVENSPTDVQILEHVRALARHCGAVILLIHVADGWAARNIRQLSLRESEEMRADREYLDKLVADLTGAGFAAEALLATGDPASEIAAAAEREHCDLIAMGTHGHRLIGDVVYGSVANAVRHRSLVPVLLVREGAAAPGTNPPAAPRPAAP